MPRKNNPKETVGRILSAALKLFHEKGFDKTSMQDIVDASDMSKGAIFYHFESKEEIFETAMEMEYEHVMQKLSAWLDDMEGMNAKEKLIAVFKKNITDEEMLSANMDMAETANNSPHLILGHMKRHMARSAELVAEIIKEGIADGSIVTDFPDETAGLFLHLLNYWCDPVLFECDMPTVRRRLECLQFIMKQLGVDIVSGEIIEITMRNTENLYKNEVK